MISEQDHIDEMIRARNGERWGYSELISEQFDRIKTSPLGRASLVYWGERLLNYTISLGCQMKMKTGYNRLQEFKHINIQQFMEQKYKMKAGQSIRERSSNTTYIRTNTTDDDAVRLVSKGDHLVDLFDVSDQEKKDLLADAAEYRESVGESSGNKPYEDMKVDEMKDELTKLELSTEGLKADLLARLQRSKEGGLEESDYPATADPAGDQ